jgi:hypothetical protein
MQPATVEEKANEPAVQDNEYDDDDEEEYEEPEPLPVVTTHNRGRRISVSAESMAPSTEKEEYVKVVIPKQQDQKQRIEKAIRANFLFKAIDDEQFTDVVNALAEKVVNSGESVITQGGINRDINSRY